MTAPTLQAVTLDLAAATAAENTRAHLDLAALTDTHDDRTRAFVRVTYAGHVHQVALAVAVAAVKADPTNSDALEAVAVARQQAEEAVAAYMVIRDGDDDLTAPDSPIRQCHAYCMRALETIKTAGIASPSLGALIDHASITA